MDRKQLISRNIEQFYNKASEETRLDIGMGVFEFERVKELIAKHIHTTPSTILDVGGGTGKYSEWLANEGHRVHLVEPVARHLQLARSRSEKSKRKFNVHPGESQKLCFPDNYADLIILHGPLYHLQKKEDRERCILEAKRIGKNDGIILGFAISYTASTLVGLFNGMIHEKSFFDMCKEELTTGIHHPPNDFPWLLAEAYYHKPEQLREEFSQLGLAYLNTYAVEGIAWLDKNFFAHMLKEETKHTLKQLIQLTENDGYLLPFSPHMMIAVKKQGTNGK